MEAPEPEKEPELAKDRVPGLPPRATNPKREFVEGAVFTLRGPKGPHDYVLITPPSFDACLVVNWTTLRGIRGEDLACTFKAGDHEWITHPSFVFYPGSEVLEPDELQDRVKEAGSRFSTELLPLPHFDRVVKGFWESGEVPLGLDHFVRDYLRERKQKGK